MTIDEALNILHNHTQYYIPVQDLEAFGMAFDALCDQKDSEKNDPITLDEIVEMSKT